MRFIEIYEVQEYHPKMVAGVKELGDVESWYYPTLEEAERKAVEIWNHLTDREKKTTELVIEKYNSKELIAKTEEDIEELTYSAIFETAAMMDYPVKSWVCSEYLRRKEG